MENSVIFRNEDGSERPVKGCLFDFDGVVVDTETYHFRSWNDSAKPLGTQLTWEEYLPLKSTGTTYISRYIMKKAGVSLSEEELHQISVRKEASFADLVRSLSREDIIPGVEGFLDWLKQHAIPTAVASSAYSSSKIATDFGLDRYFNAMFDGNTKMPRKPAPDVFLTAAKAIGIDPKDCVVFEDSFAGIGAAVNAGIPVVAVGGIHCDDAIAHIRDFQDIFSLFFCE